jgi:hypothetical protein
VLAAECVGVAEEEGAAADVASRDALLCRDAVAPDEHDASNSPAATSRMR